MGNFPWPAKGWPNKGDKVRYLATNGYEHDRNHANTYLKKDEILTIKDCSIGSWSSTYEFEEHPGKQFNTVMFIELSKEAYSPY